MPQPTYDNIAPLIADVRESGRSVQVTFRCPASSHTVNSSHSMPRDTSTQSRVMETAKRSMMYGLQSSVSQAMRSVFGYNLVGRVASDMARQAVTSASSTASGHTLSAREKQAAVLEAFRKVSAQFVWDNPRSRWIAAKASQELLSPFEQQLASHPVSHNYDRTVLARMLVEIARADGNISSEESDWLNEFIGPDLGSVAELSSRPPLSVFELNEVSQGGVRQTLLMVAWTMAIVDEDFDQREQQILRQFAQGLRLSTGQLNGARDAAQGYILDQALERMFTWGGHDAHARNELFALATRLGMTREEAERAEARYQRRKGFA